jgi:DNA-directed RNA polymerase subunit RPC12/RpoP
MTYTLIIACSRCGGLLLAKADQKTKICPYCGFKVNLRSAKKVASAKNAYDASKILQNLKTQKRFSRQKLS